MSQIIEVNIADVLIRLETKIDHLSEDVNELKVSVAKLDEKIIGLDKRLSNLEFIFRSIAGGIIIALILAAARYLFPNVTL